MGAISAVLLLGGLIATFTCIYKTMLLVMSALPGAKLAHVDKQLLLENAKDRVSSAKLLAPVLGKARERKRVEELQKGMPEVLRLLCIALESGSSLVMALRYAADNCDDPLAGELKRTVWDLEAGQGFDEALENLRARTGSSEFAYLAVAMEIQHQSGGSLTSILENVSTLLQQSAELKEELRAKTAQGRLSSRIVALVPFVLLGILSIFSPGYLVEFLSSPLGICLFALAMLLEVAGVLLVRRALAIDFTVDLEGAVWMLAFLLRLASCMLACICAYFCVRLACTRVDLLVRPRQPLGIEDILRDPTLSFLVFCGAGIVVSYAITPWLFVPCIAVAYVLSRRAPAMLDVRRTRELRSACDEQLDVMADIIAMGVRSGLSFDAALDLYCTKFDNVLARHLREAHLEWQSGITSRKEALTALSVRVNSRALRRFSETSLQAIHHGSPLADMLERFSVDIRRRRRAAIERQIAKAPVKLLIPTGTCILPAMLILIMGPVLLQFVQTGF